LIAALRLVLALCAAAINAAAQAQPAQLRPALEPPVSSRDPVAYQLQTYLLRKSPQLPRFESAKAWPAESARPRKEVLDVLILPLRPARSESYPLLVIHDFRSHNNMLSSESQAERDISLCLDMNMKGHELLETCRFERTVLI
jgi:hypothetical protein